MYQKHKGQSVPAEAWFVAIGRKGEACERYKLFPRGTTALEIAATAFQVEPSIEWVYAKLLWGWN